MLFKSIKHKVVFQNKIYVVKCAVVVFRNGRTFDGEWFWGNSDLPHIHCYNCLRVKFTSNEHWDAHVKDLVTVGKFQVNSPLKILHNPFLS